MTDLALHSDLNAEMQYASALVAQPERGAQSLLPEAYRGNPANVLIAIGLGKAIGITPAQALYEIYVVNGRPSPSANLMAALVRRAGHRLRVEGDNQSCTATLVRADDPEFPFTATWTFAQAQAAQLTNKATWKAYPAAMLRSRAIAEVVRMGAPEAVIGMEYSADEMRDVEGTTPIVQHVPRVTAADFAAPEKVVEGEVEEQQQPETDHAEPITQAQVKMLQILAKRALGDDRTQRLQWLTRTLGRQVDSANDLSKDEARTVIDALDELVAAQSEDVPA